MKQTSIMSKGAIFALGLLVFTSVASAQESASPPTSVQVEVDLLGFAQSGFGIVGGYVKGKNRIDVDLLTNTLFESFVDGSQDFQGVFDERRSVMSLIYYRYLKEEGKGFYYGAGLSYYEYIIDHTDLNETIAKKAYKPGLYVGYQVHPFNGKGFYLSAWLTYRWHWEGAEQLPFSNGDYYKIPDFDGPLPMIRLGWRFNNK